jgi:hypothetical protein
MCMVGSRWFEVDIVRNVQPAAEEFAEVMLF